MKSFVIIAVLVAVFLQAEGESINGTNIELGNFIGDELQQSFRCAMKLGSEKVTQLPSQIDETEPLPENNSVLNEYFGCIWKEKGIISENALLNEDKLKEHLNVVFPLFKITGSRKQGAVNNTVQTCKNVIDNDSGRRVVKIRNCISKCIQELIN